MLNHTHHGPLRAVHPNPQCRHGHGRRTRPRRRRVERRRARHARRRHGSARRSQGHVRGDARIDRPPLRHRPDRRLHRRRAPRHLIEERVPLVVFFWTIPPKAQIARLTTAGTEVWAQVGTVAEAQDAVAKGVTGLVVQGAEAGGHTRAEASTMTLFPRVRALFPELPMAAAGGIADGATMAAALVLGADAVWCGSRFLASSKPMRIRTTSAR
jgi:hypothetical protein